MERGNCVEPQEQVNLDENDDCAEAKASGGVPSTEGEDVRKPTLADHAGIL